MRPGSGLQKGVRLLLEDRCQGPPRPRPRPPRAPTPPSRNRCRAAAWTCSTSPTVQVPLRKRWRAVEKAFKAYEAAREAVAKAKAERPKAVGGLTAGADRLETSGVVLVVVRGVRRRGSAARGAFELFRPDGQLNDRAWADKRSRRPARC